MRNMESVISSLKKQILNPSKEYFGCNCRVRNEYPLDNKFLTLNTVYEAKVSNDTIDECKRYLGASKTLFKERLRKHIRDFKHKKYEKSTEFLKYIRTIKSHAITSVIKWSIVKRVASKAAANYGKVCLTKMFYIIQSPDDENLLNKKFELMNKCRHQNNYY